jgi:hypothetical protein
MTEPRKGNGTPTGQVDTGQVDTGQVGTGGDWRGAWKQAADGTWYRDEEGNPDEQGSSSPRPVPQAAAHGDEDSAATPRAHRESRSTTVRHRDSDQSEPETSRPQPDNRVRARHRKVSARSKWVTAGFLAVAAILVVALAREVMGTGHHPVSTTTTVPTGPPALPTKTKTVRMGGELVPTSGPVVTLNPGLVREGAKIMVTGVGFDAGSTVTLQFHPDGATRSIRIPAARAGRTGSFTTAFTVPSMSHAPGGTVTAVQRGTDKGAQAQAVVQPGVGNVALNRFTGRPGDMLTANASGFQPGEWVDAYWGRIGGKPAVRVHANSWGGLTRVPLRVGMAPVGSATLVLVGEHSQTTATTTFSVIGLYPSATVTPYSVKPAQEFSVSGFGFVPGERVLLYLGKVAGPPLTVIQSDKNGIAKGASFVAPFQLQGRQRLLMVGERSRTIANTGFMIMPYMPNAEPSTWGGMPGTELSFYASGFAPNEVVLVYAGRGQLVSAFRVDSHGSAAAAGSYTIPANVEKQTSVQLVGRQSGGVANVAVSVQGGGLAADVPPQPRYVLPPSLAQDPLVPGGPPPPPPTAPHHPRPGPR